MGYLIEPAIFKHETFYIRSSDAQTMDASAPYKLKSINNSYFIPVAANVTLDTDTFIQDYIGWNHLHLSLNDTVFAIPAIIATININSCQGTQITRDFNYQFIMNFQTSPNRFGSNIPINNDLYIWWDILPTFGDSGMYIDIYYVNQNFR